MSDKKLYSIQAHYLDMALPFAVHNDDTAVYSSPCRTEPQTYYKEGVIPFRPPNGNLSVATRRRGDDMQAYLVAAADYGYAILAEIKAEERTDGYIVRWGKDPGNVLDEFARSMDQPTRDRQTTMHVLLITAQGKVPLIAPERRTIDAVL